MSALVDFYGSVKCQYTVALVVPVIILGLMRWYKRPPNFPPGPRGIPLLGAIPFMGKYPEKAIKKWSKKYGSVMSVRMGNWEMVVLNDLKSINQAYVKQSTKFSGRPRIPIFDAFTEGFGLATKDYDESLKTQRKFGLITLRGLGMGKQSLENKVIEETSYLVEEIRQKNGEAFDMSVLLHNSVSNIICSVCFGKRFEYDDPVFKSLLKGMVEFVEDPVMNGMFTLFSFAPFLVKMPFFSSYYRQMEKIMEKLMSLINGIIKDHEDSFDEKNLRDFIDAFIKEMKEGSDPSFSKKQLAQYVRDLFEAGTQTTASTLNWSFLCLLHYPETQEKLRKEIFEVVGSSGEATWKKRSEMPYTLAFMEEVFRFKTLVPLGIQHAASEDAQLGDYFIPKGTMISSNVWAVHNDETIWNKPEVFNPERFLNDEGQFVRSQYVIPFSVGPRHCLGEQLARMEFLIFFVGLIQKFEFSSDPDLKGLPDLDKGSNGFVYTPLSYKLVAKEL